MKWTKQLPLFVVLTTVLLGGVLFSHQFPHQALAADSDLSDGITVDWTGDGTRQVGTTSGTGKSISATTTAIDNTTTSGFGSTSELGPVLAASYTAVTLADTGENVRRILMIGGGLIIVAGIIVLLARPRSKKRRK